VQFSSLNPPVVRTIQLYTQFTRKKKEFSCFLFCDFSKAFDKVWHRGLIPKMNSYGIKGPLIKWSENYLHQRKQKVINRATSSTVCEVSAGVPPRVSFRSFTIFNLYK
jgi:hypothetical protein